MTYVEAYVKAMLRGDLTTCIDLENKFDLYGYPPEVVKAGLRAADEGRNVDEAVSAYVAGEEGSK